jgi:23S rRNA (uracil1939-C5)-methyltransferase
MAVPSQGFFQANASLVGELVRQVRELSDLTGRETVLDVYAGSGLFSLFLGGLSKRLFAIEGDADAARCARMNLAREGMGHAECFTGAAAAVIGETLAPRGVKADVVVLDPPRDGCGPEVIQALTMLGPQRIVYVSCNPATQARDCRLFAEKGYALQRLQPLDMFPQTAHIEVVALLTGVKSGESTQGRGTPRGCAPSSS